MLCLYAGTSGICRIFLGFDAMCLRIPSLTRYLSNCSTNHSNHCAVSALQRRSNIISIDIQIVPGNHLAFVILFHLID